MPQQGPYYCHFSSESMKLVFTREKKKGPYSIIFLKDMIKELVPDPEAERNIPLEPYEDPMVRSLDSLGSIEKLIIQAPVLRRGKPAKTKENLSMVRLLGLTDADEKSVYTPVFENFWNSDRHTYPDKIESLRRKSYRFSEQYTLVDIVRLTDPNLFSSSQPASVKEALSRYSEGEYFGTIAPVDDVFKVGVYYTTHVVTTGRDGTTKSWKSLCYPQI